jgi:Haem-NO-binding
MKGIVFSEFIEMVDEKFSIEISQRLLDEVDLPSGGAYTSIGAYDPQEMVDMVSKLSEISSLPVPELLKEFGRHLLHRFADTFPVFFDGMNSAFDFLPQVDGYVHVEVKKLYSDAELPSFSCVSPEPGRLEMTYRSVRNLPDLAEGMILGVIEHFHESLEVTRESIPGESPAERFIVTERK